MNNLIVAVIGIVLCIFNAYSFFTSPDTFSLIMSVLWAFVAFQNLRIYFINKE